MLISSAKSRNLALVIDLLIELMNKITSKGLRWPPFGTPEGMLTKDDLQLLTFANYCLYSVGDVRTQPREERITDTQCV